MTKKLTRPDGSRRTAAPRTPRSVISPAVAVILCTGVLLAACASGNRPVQLVGGSGPVYPAAARTAGIEGFVTLRYRVSAAGAVEDVTVVASEPPGVFDDAAREALASWRFNPKKIDGKPAASGHLESTITFRLGNADEYDRY